MAKTVIVKLIDDIDGGDADETVVFGIDGKNYEIDLSKKNAASLRKALDPYIAKASSVGRSSNRTPRTGRAGKGTQTLFSQLSAEEKERFRAWAKMPAARRIGDARVKAWIDSGRP